MAPTCNVDKFDTDLTIKKQDHKNTWRDMLINEIAKKIAQSFML